MPLIFNVRHLEKKPLHLKGELPAQELDIEGVDECIGVTEPLNYDLEAQLMENAFLVQGRLQLNLECTCVRCLKEFKHQLVIPNWVCHLMRTGEDAVVVHNDVVDLTPYVREDILLAFPQHPLCESGCDGLPYPLSGSVQQPSGSHQNDEKHSAWADLNKLKFEK